MPPTDTSERELENLIVRHLSTHGYVLGANPDYQADVALDVGQLLKFLHASQPDAVRALGIADAGIARTQFLHRLQGLITQRGVVKQGRLQPACLEGTTRRPGRKPQAVQMRQTALPTRKWR